MRQEPKTPDRVAEYNAGDMSRITYIGERDEKRHIWKVYLRNAPFFVHIHTRLRS